MRVAWFAPEPHDVALELARIDVVDHYDAAHAHDFVWRHARDPYGAIVFELADTAAHAFVWPYLFHYPGILLLRATSLQHSRSDALTRDRRHHHLRAERLFSGASLLRAPLAASRLVIVQDAAAARELEESYPDVRVRVVPMGAPAQSLPHGDGSVRFHVAGGPHEVAMRAAARARDGGQDVILADPSQPWRDGDVVIALEWPPTGAPPAAAVRAAAAGLPAIIVETESTAIWPTLDPQSWRPRGYITSEASIAVSIDPRDEEHSLMLAMRRLASDADLRDRLGIAARGWAHEHASLTRAVQAWREALQEGMALPPSAGKATLPSHLTADGSEAAFRYLDAFGVTVDFLSTR